MFSRFTVLLISVTFFFSSCAKDDSTVPIGTNPTGLNALFLGTWYVTEKSKLYGDYTYNVNIADSTDNNFVLISTLYGYKTKIFATTSNRTITIPSQIIEANNVSGSGSLVNNNRIHLNYYIDTGLDKDTVTAILTK